MPEITFFQLWNQCSILIDCHSPVGWNSNKSSISSYQKALEDLEDSDLHDSLLLFRETIDAVNFLRYRTFWKMWHFRTMPFKSPLSLYLSKEWDKIFIEFFSAKFNGVYCFRHILRIFELWTKTYVFKWNTLYVYRLQNSSLFVISKIYNHVTSSSKTRK